MQKIEFEVDVTAACRTTEALACAATVVVPEAIPANPIVMFGWPGGGYSRRYFDLQLPGRGGYSQAEHHARNGHVFVACDHVAVGDSSVPTESLDHPDIGRANRAVAAEILQRLQAGTLAGGLGPFRPAAAIGMGQSYGGLLLTLAEGNEPLFDGVAFLGWSGIGTVTDPDRPADMSGWTELAANGATHPYRRIFHFDDVPEDIVVQDLSGYPQRALGQPIPSWGAKWMPGGPNVKLSQSPLAPGIVAREAAAITCPVFIGNGERDTCPQPRLEPTAYASSADITTYILPRSAHMHNFAGTRALLWERLESWAQGIAAAKSSGR